MIDVTEQIIDTKTNNAAGITFIKLQGDDDYDWIYSPRLQHPDTPSGYVSIAGSANGSTRIIRKERIDTF